MEKTVLITGASAGIGKATAIYLAQHGYKVYGAARRIEKMQDLRAYGIKPVSLDVAKDESLVTCVEQVLREAGRIDVLINNAGSGYYGALEDMPIADAKYSAKYIFWVRRSSAFDRSTTVTKGCSVSCWLNALYSLTESKRI